MEKEGDYSALCKATGDLRADREVVLRAV
jgi:hypothetical protein